ncbi:MAG: Crp/Fnr family transcriptional regulator [Mediterranea sp.]|jgi:signal-transduction protein with cAMP-binding, CBS, and nucleotidyltransferase domain|nr:Crp/Fnr family transcriptional regulator [Mediterranea sp.]
MSTMFDTLLKLPLFQGLSQEDMTYILGQAKLSFIKYKTRELIVKSNTPCTELIFLLKGQIDAQTTPENQLFTYIETINAPYLIEPEALFGMNPHFKASYTAKAEMSVMKVDKMLVLKELLKYDIFRLNYVNSISNRAQSLYSRLWKTPASGTVRKIIHFFLIYAEKPEGEKTIIVKMEDLAKILDDTRLNISKALNDLQNQGLIELGRKVIHIPELGKLPIPTGNDKTEALL